MKTHIKKGRKVSLECLKGGKTLGWSLGPIGRVGRLAGGAFHARQLCAAAFLALAYPCWLPKAA